MRRRQLTGPARRWALVAGVGALVLAAPVAAEAEVKIAGSARAAFAGYAYVGGYQPPPISVQGIATSATIVPDRTATPVRLQVGMFRERSDIPTVPLRITLHEAGADGLPGSTLATTNLTTADLSLGVGSETSIPVTGWPRLQAGQRYAIAAVMTAATRIGWSVDDPTATVPGYYGGQISAGATEPVWNASRTTQTVLTEVYANDDAPETTIIDGPAALTNDATPTFSFSSSEVLAMLGVPLVWIYPFDQHEAVSRGRGAP